MQFLTEFFGKIGEYAGNLPRTAWVLVISAVFVGAFWYVKNWFDGYRAARSDAKDKGEKLGLMHFVRSLGSKAMWTYNMRELFATGTSHNWAYLTMRAGVLFAQTYAMAAAIEYFNPKYFWRSTLDLIAKDAWIIVALLISTIVIDFVVMPRVSNVKLMMKGKLSVGIIEAACFAGIGMLLRGSLTGVVPSTFDYKLVTVVFFAIGLTFVMGVFLFHELVTPYNVREDIRNNRLASPIETAGVILVTSRIAQIGVTGDFTVRDGWGGNIAACLATALIGMALYYLFRWLIDKVIMIGVNTRQIAYQGRVAASVLVAVLMVCFAQDIVASVNTLL